MKRRIIIASHSMLSDGIAKTLQFFQGKQEQFTVITAYVDNKPIDEQIEQIFNEISVEDEVVILTDLLAGSVNQKFVPYSSRPHTHLVAGMNLPLAMAFSMEPCHEYMSSDRIQEIVKEAQDQVKYVNLLFTATNEDDEDE